MSVAVKADTPGDAKEGKPITATAEKKLADFTLNTPGSQALNLVSNRAAVWPRSIAPTAREGATANSHGLSTIPDLMAFC